MAELDPLYLLDIFNLDRRKQEMKIRGHAIACAFVAGLAGASAVDWKEAGQIAPTAESTTADAAYLLVAAMEGNAVEQAGAQAAGAAAGGEVGRRLGEAAGRAGKRAIRNGAATVARAVTGAAARRAAVSIGARVGAAVGAAGGPLGIVAGALIGAA